MGAFEFLLTFTFLAAGILASVGYAVITVTPADFKLARALFLIAGALVFTDGIMWGVLTDSPLWTRILIVGLIGAVSAVAANEAIRWINNREKIAEPPPAQTKSHIEACAQTFYGMRPGGSSNSLAERSTICPTIKSNPRTVWQWVSGIRRKQWLAREFRISRNGLSLPNY